MNNSYVKIIFNIAIFSLIGLSIAYASSNPLDSIKTNLDSTATIVISIVQIFGILGLVFYGGYCLFSGNLDKIRLTMIIVAILIISGAKSFVELLQGWVN